MSGHMSGADADQLDRLAAELERLAGRAGRSRSVIGAAVRGAPWHGRSAEAFRGRWSSEYSRSLSSAEAFLRDAGVQLRRNAREQREASGIGPARRSFWDRIRVVGIPNPIDALRRWRDRLGPWAATALTLVIAGVLTPTVGLLPGLIVGLSLSTGASPMEAIRSFGSALGDVARSRNLSPRIRAFVDLCKAVPPVGDVIDLGVLTWDTGAVVIYAVTHGPNDEAMRRLNELELKALDFGVGVFVDRSPVSIGTNVNDLIHGTSTNEQWDAVSTPSGLYDLVTGATSRIPGTPVAQ